MIHRTSSFFLPKKFPAQGTADIQQPAQLNLSQQRVQKLTISIRDNSIQAQRKTRIDKELQFIKPQTNFKVHLSQSKHVCPIKIVQQASSRRNSDDVTSSPTVSPKKSIPRSSSLLERRGIITEIQDIYFHLQLEHTNFLISKTKDVVDKPIEEKKQLIINSQVIQKQGMKSNRFRIQTQSQSTKNLRRTEMFRKISDNLKN